MTITTRKKRLTGFHIALMMLGAAIAIGAGGTVLLHNQNIGVRHETRETRARADLRAVRNAELKQELSTLRAGASLETIVRERNLIKDEHPRYLIAQSIQ
ncbi:MAG: hypothetical protein HYS43_01265 [Candidatus Liptonbacteria bacterium]|nr:hypothetical protein [Candidatus Liptonbacteria bacterium]